MKPHKSGGICRCSNIYLSVMFNILVRLAVLCYCRTWRHILLFYCSKQTRLNPNKTETWRCLQIALTRMLNSLLWHDYQIVVFVYFSLHSNWNQNLISLFNSEVRVLYKKNTWEFPAKINSLSCTLPWNEVIKGPHLLGITGRMISWWKRICFIVVLLWD